MDLVGTCDAYVEMELGGADVDAGTSRQHRKSSVKKNTYAPSWNEEFEMEVAFCAFALRCPVLICAIGVPSYAFAMCRSVLTHTVKVASYSPVQY
eukprot:2661359-Rhodomonas_salina.3